MRIFTSLSLLLIATSAIAAQESAEGVVKKAIAAMGVPNDGKPYYQTWHEQGKMNFGGASIVYDSYWTFEPSDKYRFEMKGEFQGQKIEIVFIQNGNQAKESAMGQSRMVEGEKLEETTHSLYQLWVNSLTPLVNDTAFKLKLLGERSFAGKSVVSVLVSREGKRDVTLHFDKNTHYLAGCTDKVKDEFQGWKEVTQDAEFSDYEKLATGEMVFKNMVLKREGKVLIESKMSESKRHAGSKPEAFKLD
ncbi:MAG: hypothetical protein JNJ77_10935 [Planctomycetia bacterium]|nr:hypothetical protein [Planctomycetia bacterium]